MDNDHVAGIGIATHEEPDVALNPYPSYRAGSCGSATSFGELRGSQGSIRYGSHLSCRSSVRDESHIIDESRRKQRVIRYMQEERERAARAKLEREEHSDWMTFRALVRCERMQYMNDDERAEFLQQEALEAERERVAAEEVARKVAQAALNRRYSAANTRPRLESQEVVMGPRGGKEAFATVPHNSSMAANQTPTTEELESLRKKVAAAQKLEVELRSELLRAHDAATNAQAVIEKARQMQRTAEESLLREAKRANDEAAMRKIAEDRAASLEKGIEDMQRRIVEMEEELRRLRKEAEKEALVADEKERQLKPLREQLSGVRKENAALEAKCKELRAEKDALTMQARNIAFPKPAAKQKRQPQRNPIRANHLGDAVAQTVLKSSQQPLEAANNASRDDWDAVQALGSQSEMQATTFEQVKEENGVSKDHLQQNETRMIRKFEDRATQAHCSQNEECPREELKQAEAEVKQYKAEAAAARQESKELRVTTDKEIAFLKAWCARLDEQCKQQMSKLRDLLPREKNGADQLRSVNALRDLAGAPATGDSALPVKLQPELSEVRARLKVSEKAKQHDVAMADSLKSEQGFSCASGVHGNSDTLNLVGVFSNTKKEPRGVEAAREAVQEEPAAERNKVEPLQRERGLLPETMGLTGAKMPSVHVTEDVRVGTGAPCVASNGVSAGLEELYEKLASLQQELERERQVRMDAEREAAAQKARADTAAAASLGNTNRKDKAKCHC
ncbi:200 kDa antigen p200 [Trypanosoma rangeli]|uniref:200 kDa antigen p200 n=1 Tax=Trypanosoma rangeli TaxID=5698 RepID=A0A3R7NBX7_TRYRA|nr:200 kDa antigen p200 [Trypanosoma rangeli]RNF04024.1 200 kDa antigen p200 [Trypanosoma rangeli]|eukprot:RNF04024.1 200 kDa antigen p200 [Trypanosoma rangeli]